MSRLLVRAAEAWLRRNPPESEEPLPTSQNGFIVEAERAYWAALEDWIKEQRRRPAPPQLPESGWVVYRLIGGEGRVFYVGMSGRPRQRIATHRREFGERITRVEWESFPSRVAAYDAETALIRELQPPLNIAKVPI